MKIGFFTETYIPNRDGVVASILNTRKELEKRGHEAYIFCAGSRKAKKENTDKNVFYHLSTPFKPYPDYRIALFPFFSLRKVKKLNIQILHTHGMATMGLAAVQISKILHLPLVGSFHTLIPEATHYITKRKILKRLTHKIAWRYLRWYYKLCDMVICPTHTLKSILEEHGIKNVFVVPNGIDIKKFTPTLSGELIRKALGLENQVIVLHVGRLVIEKNLDVLIKSALLIVEEIPECKFLIVGDGPARKYYEKLVKDENIESRFIFTGFVEDEKLPFYYACADIFAFPSKFETQGLVAIEAMSCGIPVAGANYLGTKDIVKDGYNGYLFNPDNAEDCAEKIIKTIENRKKMKKNARKTAEEYSIENTTEKLLKIYEDALARYKK